MPRPVLAEVVRSGFVESVHTGSVIALYADGTEALRLGEPAAPAFPRSANKPLQAVGLLRAGLDLDGELLAVAAASHSGEPDHLRLVRRILTGAGLDETALRNPPTLPMSEAAAQAVLRAGGEPTALTQNCSGKHAAMLATCVRNGWPIESYLDPAAPVQRAVRSSVSELAGEEPAATGIDGCGAPLLALSLLALARAFGRLMTAAPGSAERRVADAMRAHPAAVGGTGRPATRLMVGVPGLLAKDGAEGVFAAALPDGAAVAVKIDDGAERAAVPVLVAALRVLGCGADVLDDLATWPVTGGGARVGAVRAVSF